MKYKSRLVLHNNGASEADVYVHTFLGFRDELEQCIGYVEKNFDGSWRARGNLGENHGDSYLTRWDAARQLALGLGHGASV